METAKFFTPEEVAKRYRVQESTVRGWIRKGWMSALNLGCGGRVGPYVVSTNDLDEFEAAHYQKSSV